MPENSDHEILVIYQTPHYEPSRREVKKDAKTRRVNDSVGAHGKYVDTSCPSDLPVGWFTHFGFGRDDGTHLTEDDLHNRGLPENDRARDGALWLRQRHQLAVLDHGVDSLGPLP